MSAARLMRAALVLSLAAAVSAAVVTAAASGAGGPIERITLTSTTVKGVDKKLHVVAHGPIAGNGTYTGVQTPGSSRDRITLRFRNGSVFLVGNDEDSKVTPDLHSCTARGIGHGTYTITGGTGRYRGVTGEGSYTRRLKFIGARDKSGACLGQNAQPRVIQYTAALVGTAALASS